MAFVGNVKERCNVVGEGLPLILVHGMGGTIVWESIVPLLSKNYRIIIPTFPGFRKGDGIIEYTDDYFVEFLEQVRISFSLDKVNLVGVSMGGRTVLNYITKYSANVKTLTVIDGAGLGNMSPLFIIPIISRLFERFLVRILGNPKNVVKLGINDFVDTNSDTYTTCSKYFLSLMEDDIVRCNFVRILTKIGKKKEEWKEQLPRINVPTLILWAKDDKTTPVKWAYTLDSLMGNSKLEVLGDYRHMAILENPLFFEKQIQDHLEEVSMDSRVNVI